MANDSCIIDKCKLSWEESFVEGHTNYKNCSGFVKSVAEKLGVNLPNINADGLVSYIALNWKQLDSASEAASKAALGYFVLAGLKGADHSPARGLGHIAVVISGNLYRGIYPKTWGGSTGAAQSQGTKSTGEIWNRQDRDNVGYYMYQIMVCT